MQDACLNTSYVLHSSPQELAVCFPCVFLMALVFWVFQLEEVKHTAAQRSELMSVICVFLHCINNKLSPLLAVVQ